MKTHLIVDILKCIFYTEMVVKNSTCIGVGGRIVKKVQKGGIVNKIQLPGLTKNAYHTISYYEKNAYHTISYYEKKRLS